MTLAATHRRAINDGVAAGWMAAGAAARSKAGSSYTSRLFARSISRGWWHCRLRTTCTAYLTCHYLFTRLHHALTHTH